MAACEHGGVIFLGGESLCGECYQKAIGAVYCPEGGQMALPDKFGCQRWQPADALPPLRWCFWCRGYNEVRWPGSAVVR